MIVFCCVLPASNKARDDDDDDDEQYCTIAPTVLASVMLLLAYINIKS